MASRPVAARFSPSPSSSSSSGSNSSSREFYHPANIWLDATQPKATRDEGTMMELDHGLAMLEREWNPSKLNELLTMHPQELTQKITQSSYYPVWARTWISTDRQFEDVLRETWPLIDRSITVYPRRQPIWPAVAFRRFYDLPAEIQRIILKATKPVIGFPGLPFELRQFIWEFIIADVNPRIVDIIADAKDPEPMVSKAPHRELIGLRTICKQARDAVDSRYRQVRLSSDLGLVSYGHDAIFPFDDKTDTLFFTGNSAQIIIGTNSTRGCSSNNGLQGFQQIALSQTNLTNSLLQMDTGNWMFTRNYPLFRSLQTLYVVDGGSLNNKRFQEAPISWTGKISILGTEPRPSGVVGPRRPRLLRQWRAICRSNLIPEMAPLLNVAFHYVHAVRNPWQKLLSEEIRQILAVVRIYYSRVFWTLDNVANRL